MKLFLSYIRTYRTFAVCGVLFAAIFTAVFLLYRLPVAATLYAALICGVIFIIVTAVSFISYYKKHYLLSRLCDEISVTDEHLPQPRDMTEADYQAIIRSLRTEMAARSEIMSNAAAEQSEYYAVWAHQIKTPIAAMRLLLSSDDGISPDYKSELSVELFRIEQYVEMALCYLKLGESGDYLIRTHPLDDIIRACVRKYARQFIRKKIKLEYIPVSKKVITDDKWLSFVIEQILSNSLKYTDTGFVKIYFDDSKNSLVISDSGIGIDAADLPRVFDYGYTGANGHNDKRATGIGLYLCRRLLSSLGHNIKIESRTKRGHGTDVYIGFTDAGMKCD